MANSGVQNRLVLGDEVVATPAEYYGEYNGNGYNQSNANILILDENRNTDSRLSDVCDADKQQCVVTQSKSNIEQAVDGDASDEEQDMELSPGGILDEETVGRGLSNLGRSADGTQQVFLHVTLPGFSLVDITLMENYVHLQKVEIPYNSITDLSPLSHMPYLLELDASHNEITALLDFTPPKNLKIVDLSFNKIEEMTDLSDHHYLQKLILDNNEISEIKGLNKCHRLQHLSLVHNKLTKISGLDGLPIKILNLRGNEIRKIEDLEQLKYLQNIILSGNKIRSMNNLQRHEFLEQIDLEDNEIIDLSELQYIQELRMLRDLNLQRNPIQELPDYRLSILFHLPSLTELDRHRASAEEKVQATNLFNPPMEVIASRDHIMNVMFAFRQPCTVLDSTLPSIETPYPMLVLVGPQGAGKKDLALKLTEEFPDYFGYGISHTTRKPYHEEAQGKDYHFVSLDEFENEIKYGKFIQTYHNNDNFYGLTLDAVESVAREGLACVVHMELEGVLSLKKTYFEPRYVLIMPLSKEIHERRLRDRGIYTEEQIALNLERAEKYIEQNQDHPGFFDMFINSDDITESYWRLRQLVMDYLGISMPNPSLSSNDNNNIDINDKDITQSNTAAGSARPIDTRAWSKTSLTDSLNQTQTTFKLGPTSPATAPACLGRGIVEEESLKRRHSAAKNAVTGFQPTIYEQVLSKMPKTAPTSLYGIHSLADSHDTAKRSFSAPVDKSILENVDEYEAGSVDDSSSANSGSSSSLSNLSDQSVIDRREESDAGSPQPDKQHTIDRLELMSNNHNSPSESRSFPLPPTVPRPGTGGGSRPASRSASAQLLIQDTVLPPQRPGSEKHKVLPPISPQPNMLPEY